MSVSAMTNVAMARKIPSAAPRSGRRGPMAETALNARKDSGEPSTMIQALDVLTAYIPTEILTIYVATIAALETAAGSGLAGWIAFWFFLVATPLVVWLVYAAKVRQEGEPVPFKPSAWPKWEMIAAVIAYVAWAFALPGTPFRTSFPDFYNPAIAGILVMVTAGALGLIAPVVQPKPAAADP